MKKHIKLSLFSLSPPSPSNNIIFIPLSNFGKDTRRQQQSQKSLFLNISTRNLPFPSLCGTILLSLDLLDFQTLFHLLPLRLSCSKSNDWAVPTSSCSRAARCSCCFNLGVWPPKGTPRCLLGSGSPRAEVHTGAPGSGQRWHMQRTRGSSQAFSQQTPRRITQGEQSQPSQTIQSLSQDSPACTSMTETSLPAI